MQHPGVLNRLILTTCPALLIVLVAVMTNAVAAQEVFVRIQSAASPGAVIHVENGPVEAGERRDGDWSADWIFEPADATYVRIKNRWRGGYLHTRNREDTVELGELDTAWTSMMWEVVQAQDGYRLRNRRSGLYLRKQGGAVQTAPLAQTAPEITWMLTNYSAPSNPQCFIGDRCPRQRLVSNNARCLEATGGTGSTLALADTCTNRAYSLNEPLGMAHFPANGSIQFNGQCLASQGPDAQPILQQCSVEPAQRWRPAAKLLLDSNGLCLTATGDSVRTSQCAYTPQQAWGRIALDPNQPYTVKAVYLVADDSPNKQRANVLSDSLSFIQSAWADDGLTFTLDPTVEYLGRETRCASLGTLQGFREHTVRQLSLRGVFDLNTKYVVVGECDVEGAANADQTVSVYAPWILTNSELQLRLNPATADNGAMSEVGSFGHELGHSFGLDHENCAQGGFQGGADEGGRAIAAGMPTKATSGPMCNGRYFPNVAPVSAYQRNRLFERSCKWFAQCGAGYDEFGAKGRPWDCAMWTPNEASFKASPIPAQLQLHRFTYEENRIESYEPFSNQTGAKGSQWERYDHLYLLKGAKNYFAISDVGAPNGQAFRCYGFVDGPTTTEPDNDGDGIADSADRCPTTSAMSAVDRDGCAFTD